MSTIEQRRELTQLIVENQEKPVCDVLRMAKEKKLVETNKEFNKHLIGLSPTFEEVVLQLAMLPAGSKLDH